MNDKVKLKLANCYGIRGLEDELVFKHKGYAIYAPNGVMKTSFAKTMMDLSKGVEPKDQAFPDRKTICEITWNGEPIKEDEIFVVKSYDEKYPLNGVSTLLANESLKKRYENIHRGIDEAKKKLDKKLRSLAGYGERSRLDLDQIFESVFNTAYYDALLDLKSEIQNCKEEDYSEADHKIIFNPKVITFLEEGGTKEYIEDFAEKYEELTEQSPILNRDFQLGCVFSIALNFAI